MFCVPKHGLTSNKYYSNRLIEQLYNTKFFDSSNFCNYRHIKKSKRPKSNVLRVTEAMGKNENKHAKTEKYLNNTFDYLNFKYYSVFGSKFHFKLRSDFRENWFQTLFVEKWRFAKS